MRPFGGLVEPICRAWPAPKVDMISSDVIVIGGGLVGTVVAYGLALVGRNVTVLDEGDDVFRASRKRAAQITCPVTRARPKTHKMGAPSAAPCRASEFSLGPFWRAGSSPATSA